MECNTVCYCTAIKKFTFANVKTCNNNIRMFVYILRFQAVGYRNLHKSGVYFCATDVC